ncbi:MAG TPA: prepilin-type N-terminal cleavage/methylation domain-containing protein [Gemmatimonadaceae bacterium]|nr:prepilin-type N-terminal cleavage/methylation domain-containing protein [Gemmatimonadaceae bacterium]
MLIRRSDPRRRAFTLVELLVAMTVAGIVLTLITLTGLRQQRLLSDLADDASLAAQLREAAAILPVDIRALSATAGDLRDARDTVLEMRSTIASGVVCDTAQRSLVLPPATDGTDAYASYMAPIEAGDSAWLFTPTDSADTWQAHAITSVGSAPPGQCAAGGPRLADSIVRRSRVAIVLDSAASVVATPGRPLRVTRPVRYSLYRSSDGSWNLGEREWNPAQLRFNGIQPVAGPLLPASAQGLAFDYLDSTRAPMPTPLATPRAVAAITLTLRGETRNAVRALGSGRTRGKRTDSISVSVLVHNRR